MKKIGFIGSGNIASALANAILEKGVSREIIMSDKNPEKLKGVKKSLRVNVTLHNKEVVNNSEIVFIAVKPQDIDVVLEEIKEVVVEQLIVSIAAGIKLDYLQSRLKNARIIRVMPNIACLVGEMSAGYSLGKFAKKQDSETLKQILDSAGKSVLVDERFLDVITVISGSAPAFISYFSSAIISCGVNYGLSKEDATTFTKQTLLGTAKLLSEKKISPEELIMMVASKRGVTEAGINVFEAHKVKQIIGEAITKAIERSKEIGEQR